MPSAITYMDVCIILQLLLVGVSCDSLSAQEPLCTPGEEHRPHNITLSCTGETVIWSKNNSTIIICVGNKCQVQLGFSGYNLSVSSSASTLIINNVTRQSAGTYRCRPETRNASCDFKVYARPTSVSCQQAELKCDTVTVVCAVKRIYPNPICQFVWTTNGTANQITPEQISYENITDAADPAYFNVQCRLNLPALKLSKGSHQFGVFVYPNVTGRDSDSIYGVNSDLTYPQSVAYPSVELDSCPETYVVEGNEFSCTCRETVNVFIPANTTLVYGSASVTNGAVGSVTGTFTANRTTTELGCQAKLRDGTSVVVTHKLLVASQSVQSTSDVNVAGVAGGAVAAVLAAVATATVIVVVRRKGLKKCWLKRNRDNESIQPSEYMQVSPSHFGSQGAAAGSVTNDHQYDEISIISSREASFFTPQPFPASRNVTNQYENVISD